MKVSNALYTYPVLSNSGLRDDYLPQSDFSAVLEKEQTGVNEMSLSVSVNLSDDNLSELLADGDLKLVCHVESSLSSYRQVVDIDSFDRNLVIKIDPTIMRGILEVTVLAVAAKTIEQFNSDSFSEFYSDTYLIEKGDVLAYAPTVEVEIEPDDIHIESKKSIIQVSGRGDIKEMEVNLENNHILIYLPIETFKGYKMLSKKETAYHKISIMAVVLPALMEAIRYMNEEGNIDKLWAKVITSKLKSGGKGSDPTHYEPLTCSQYLLNNPAVDTFSPIIDAMGGDD